MKSVIIPYFFCCILSVFIVFIFILSNGYNISYGETTYISNNSWNLNKEYIWPVIGYNTITSYFGKRNAPTKGASSYHSGIDIGAPTGSNLVAITNGKVIFTGFKGAGGYTIIIENANMQISYCHVHNNYLPKVGSYVTTGQVIGKVGPKNVYGVSNNPYKDKNGNPTNGATTGPHLHFGIKVDGKNVNPLNYLTI